MLESDRQALVIRERLAREHPEVAEYQTDLAGSYHNIALLLIELDRGVEALESFRRGLAIRERLARERRRSPNIRATWPTASTAPVTCWTSWDRRPSAMELHRRCS